MILEWERIVRDRVALGSEDSVSSHDATLDSVKDPSADWGSAGETRKLEKSLDIFERMRFSSTGEDGWGIGFEADEPMTVVVEREDCGGRP